MNNIDRNKHNKYVVGWTPTIPQQDTTSSSTSTSTTTIIVGGGGSGSGTGLTGEQAEKLESIEYGAQVNQNAYSYLSLSDGTTTVIQAARLQRDTANLSIIGKQGIETSLVCELKLPETTITSTGQNTGVYKVSYGKVINKIETPSEDPEGEPTITEEITWPLIITYVSGEQLQTTSFDTIKLINQGVETTLTDYQIETNETGITSITKDQSNLIFDQIKFTLTTTPEATEEVPEPESITTEVLVLNAVVYNYCTYYVSNTGDGYWKLDEDGNLYTDYNAYSTKELSAYGLGEGTGGTGGGAGYLYELGDVDEESASSPINGGILQYNATTHLWEVTDGSNINPDLKDYAKVEWVNDQIAALIGDAPADLDTLGEIATRLQSLEVLLEWFEWDDTNQAIKALFNLYGVGEISAYGYRAGGGETGGKSYLNELEDVDITNLQNQGILQYNATTKMWEVTDGSSIRPDLSGYAETTWVTQQINNAVTNLIDGAPSDLNTLGKIATVIEELQQFLDWFSFVDGRIRANYDLWGVGEISAYGYSTSEQPTGKEYLRDLLDVNVDNATSGQILMFNGTTWVSQDIPETGLNESELAQYLITNNYLQEGDVTWSNLSGKPTSFDTTISQITNLHSSWDNLLTNAVTDYVTRWPAFKEVTDKPTTLAGYGITDAYTKTESDDRYVNITGDTMTGDLKLPNLEASGYVMIGSAVLSYDSTNGALKLATSTGGIINFYATGEISAYGYRDDDITSSNYLRELKDVILSESIKSGDLLMYDASDQTWHNVDKSSVGLNEEELQQYLTDNDYLQSTNVTWDLIKNHPTTLEGYGITDALSETKANDLYVNVTGDTMSGTLNINSSESFGGLLKLTSSGTNTTTVISFNNTSTDLGYIGVADKSVFGLNYSVPIFASANTTNSYYALLNTRDFQGVRQFTVDLRNEDASNFYPLVFTSDRGYSENVEVQISSQTGQDTMAYNANHLHFLIRNGGWSDNGNFLFILNHHMYDHEEMTIGCIGRGSRDGTFAVWLRGGVTYRIYANTTFRGVDIHTTDFTYGGATYTVGTNLYGGTNANVTIKWTPSYHYAYTYIDNNLQVGSIYSITPNTYTIGQPENRWSIVYGVGGNYSSYIQIGNGRIKWDSTNNALYVEDNEGNAINFYSTGEVSAYGYNNSSIESANYLSELKDVSLTSLQGNDILIYNSSTKMWSNVSSDSLGLNEEQLQEYLDQNKYLKEGDIAWSSITGKPTTLSGYGITDAYTSTQSDERYVNITGDTMTGDLTSVSFRASNVNIGYQLGTSNGNIAYKNNGLRIQSPNMMVLENNGSSFLTEAHIKATDTWIHSNTNYPLTVVNEYDEGLVAIRFKNTNDINGIIGIGGTFSKYPQEPTFQVNNGEWELILTEANYNSTVESDYKLLKNYSINLSSLSSSNFYPVVFYSNTVRTEQVTIQNQSAAGAAAYNFDVLSFEARAGGWSDTGTCLFIKNHFTYQSTEISLGSIVFGGQNGGFCVFVRGGNVYNIVSTCKCEGGATSYTYMGTTYNYGTSKTGGSNTNAIVVWTSNVDGVPVNQGTSAYLRGSLAVQTSLFIGGVRLRWDSTNNALVVESKTGGQVNLYSTGEVSAYGMGQTGSAGLDEDLLWDILGGNSTEQINISHLTNALANYLKISSTESNGTQVIATDIRLKGNSNYGRTLYFGDASYAYIQEKTDNDLTIHATDLNLEVSRLLLNGEAVEFNQGIESVNTTGSGNAVTSISANGTTLNVTKSLTFYTGHDYLTSSYSFNDALLGGAYYTTSDSWATNGPGTGYRYGILAVFNTGHTEKYIGQLWMSHSAGSDGGVYVRVKYEAADSNWSAWRRLIDNQCIGSYALTQSNYTQYVTKVGTSTVGSTTRPIYLNAGTPTACSHTLSASINSGSTGNLAYYSSSSTIEDYASTVGSGTRLWYLNTGTPTNSSSTIGSNENPVFLSSGSITASSKYFLVDIGAMRDTSTGTNWNNLLRPGMYFLATEGSLGSETGSPGSSYYGYGNLLVFGSGTAVYGGARTQLYFEHGNGAAYRTTYSASSSRWQAWNKILTDRNIGNYALTPSNYSNTLNSVYVNVSGDTMTGALVLNSTLRVSGASTFNSQTTHNYGIITSSLTSNNNITAKGAIILDYYAGTWLSMCTRTDDGIYSNNKASSGSAHMMMRMRNYNGDYVVLGGLNNETGVYYFTNSNVTSGVNNYSARTIWTSEGMSVYGTRIYTNGYMRIGDGTIRWDSSTNSLYVEKYDGSRANLYATGEVSAYGKGTGTPTAQVVSIMDVRNNTIYPNTYDSGMRIFFKKNGTAVLTSSQLGGEFHTLIQINKWHDSSGGRVHQIALGDNNSIWSRVSNSSITGWETWQPVKPNLGNWILNSNGPETCYFEYGSVPFYVAFQNGWCPGVQKHGIVYLGDSTHRWRQLYASNSVNTSSDIRLKDVVRYVDLKLGDIANAPAFTYSWKDNKFGEGIHVGGSAQYWQNVLPEVVVEGDDGYLSMEYDRITYAAVISLAKETESIEERVTKLESENAELKAKIERYEKLNRQRTIRTDILDAIIDTQ